MKATFEIEYVPSDPIRVRLNAELVSNALICCYGLKELEVVEVKGNPSKKALDIATKVWISPEAAALLPHIDSTRELAEIVDLVISNL